MKVRKRVISWMLILTMAISMLPVLPVRAEEMEYSDSDCSFESVVQAEDNQIADDITSGDANDEESDHANSFSDINTDADISENLYDDISIFTEDIPIPVNDSDTCWLSNFEIESKNKVRSTDTRSLVTFAQETSDYSIEFPMGASRAVYLTATEEAVTAGVYYQFLLNDTVRSGDDYKPKKITSSDRTAVSVSSFTSNELSWTENTLTLLVGPLSEGEENLSKDNCNVYNVSIKLVAALQDLTLSNADNSESYTIAPVFHMQDTAYSAEVTGRTVKLGAKHVTGVTLTLPNGESDTGTSTQSWFEIDLTKYMATGSNVASVPVKISYTNEGTTYERTITLNLTVDKGEEAHQWISNFEVEIADSASNPDVRSLITFDKETTEYTIDFASGGVLGMYLTPTAEVSGKDVYYQFLLNNEVRDGETYKPQKIEGTERINVTTAAISTTNLAYTEQTLTLLVGTLADGAENLSVDGCNAYNFKIKKVPSFNTLEILGVVDESTNETCVLNPTFHRQDVSFSTETSADTVKIGIGLSGATVTLPNKEPNTGTETEAWYTVKLADYTDEGSDTAKIPMTVNYTSSGNTYSRVITLLVTWKKVTIPPQLLLKGSRKILFVIRVKKLICL